jgi:hypothetical protein
VTQPPETHEPAPLSARLIAYYRETVAIHADDAVTGTCPVCRVSRCPDARYAAERLTFSASARSTLEASA